MAEVAVAGATGALGSKICHALLARGAAVRALVRDPASGSARALADAGADVVRADLTEPGSVAPAVEGVACVVSTATCFPRDDAIEAVDRDGNLALVDAAEAAGASRFVFVSFRPVALDFPLQRAKRAVEERLAEARLDAVVLRPGKLMDVWFSPVCGFDASVRCVTLFGAATAPVTWIAAADVAEMAARAANGEGPRAGTFEVGGPEPLSQREVVAIYEEASGAAWVTETLPVAELERMHQHGESAVIRSLGALMLEAHLGSTTDPASFYEAFPLRLTTVREFAGGYSPSG
ncbi:MAG TPA: NmrA family NAD(P)-binding protein [Gaiellaceae bacterium]